MVITTQTELPTEEELTVQEIHVGSSGLRAAAFLLGKQCENQNSEFILCRDELKDPTKCLEEGKAVTSCALNFFRMIKKTCYEEFTQYATCIDKSSSLLEFKPCRKTQGVFDKCMLDNWGLQRPEYGYFCEAKVINTKRPKPEPPKPAVYPDATPGLPPDYPRPPAKYGARKLIYE